MMRAVSIVLLCSLLFACGFEPLYARRSTGGGTAATTDQLASVYIEQVDARATHLITLATDLRENRAGQELYNALRDQMNPHGVPQRPAYRLSLQLIETKTDLATRGDQFATRANLTISVTYTLARASDGARLYVGRQAVTASYNLLGSESMFSNLTSENEARSRAATEMAQILTSRLSVLLSPQAPPLTPATTPQPVTTPQPPATPEPLPTAAPELSP